MEVYDEVIHVELMHTVAVITKQKIMVFTFYCENSSILEIKRLVGRPCTNVTLIFIDPEIQCVFS